MGKTLKLMYLLLLGGCVATSQVVPYGNGVYMIEALDGWGVKSQADVLAEGVKKADAYCGQLGKSAQVKQDSASYGPNGTQGRLIFVCAEK